MNYTVTSTTLCINTTRFCIGKVSIVSELVKSSGRMFDVSEIQSVFILGGIKPVG